MSGKRVYGRAYPIKQSDAKAYRRVDRNLRANPIGVTAMAAVNGRGSAKSARAVAQGKTRSQRIARAESVYKNGEKTMGVLKNKRKTGAAKKKSSSTSRRKVSGTNYYRTSGGRYQNAAGKFVKKDTVKASKKAKKKSAPKKRTTAKRTTAKRTTAKRTAPKRRATSSTTKRRAPARKTRKVRKNASVGYTKKSAAGYDRMARSAAGKKAAATRKRRAAAAARTQGRSKTVGKYKRVRIADPKTGKMKLSYMYETKGGKRRKIPTSAVTRSGHKTAAEIKRGRAKAAARVKREGSAFVANRSGKASARQKRAGKRLAAYMAAKRSGKTVAQARSAAIRKVPLARGDQFKGVAKAPVTTTKKRTKVRRNKKRSTTTALRKNGKRRVRRNAKRRVVRKSPVKANARRKVRRKTTAKKKTTAKRRKRRAAPVKRRRTASKRRRTTTKRRKTTASKRRRTMRRNGTVKRYRKNAFMANLKAVLKTGMFVATGFLVHRIATNLIAEKALATTLPDNQAFQDWKKPLVGFGMMLVGIPVAGMAVPKRGIEIGAGMFASFLQSTIIAALGAAGQPNLVSSVAGYGNSRAYALRGNRRRRGMRGMERHATSIMPRYTPVSGYSQAAAGYQQAAAGQFQQAAAGEYFTATGEYFTATGEYFAPQGTKGVGGYEPAGELAMQASAGTSQVIRDGLRPDGDLDYALDVAEAAAGLGEATAIEHRVGQQSQWIPNNPLWAGERPVTHSQATSEISAGILQRPGGNGILSGG